MQEITRQIMWNVTTWMSALLYGGALVAVALAFWRMFRRYRVWRLGKPADIEVSFGRAVSNIAAWIFRRGKMPRDRFADVMHALILYGFIILLIGTTLDGIEHQLRVHVLYGPFYLVFSFALELGGLAFLAGLLMAVYRRHIRRAGRLKPSPWIDGMLLLMIAIDITGFVLEALRISVRMPSFEIASFVGYSLASAFRLFALPDSLAIAHRYAWVTHAVLCIAFFGLATVFFFRHVVVSMLPVALRPERARGALRKFELPALAPSPTGVVADLSWKDLLDADACTTCGRCTAACPATAAGKALDPRAVVLKLSTLISSEIAPFNGHRPSAFDTISDAEIWDCTTCGACVAECPVDIEVFHKIVSLRRQRVDSGRIYPGARKALEATDLYANPWEHPPAQRTAWANRLHVPVSDETPEWIYWIGCAGALDASGQSISLAMVEILKAAGVNFAILGREERCTGDPARRIGDETLFQSCRERNIETLRRRGVRKIITHCPHCFNTFRNEYWQGEQPEFEVVHHSQFLRQLIEQGKINLTNLPGNVNITFHDPCYLGRHNGEFAAPRAVVDSIPGVQRTEMNRSKERSFCCGGGGGQMWLESTKGDRIENLRMAEARATGAGVVATACPFCKVMMETANASAGQLLIQIKDIAELVNEARIR
jgi:Fe-S oxidoreductase